jgi:hypothetical protein
MTELFNKFDKKKSQSMEIRVLRFTNVETINNIEGECRGLMIQFDPPQSPLRKGGGRTAKINGMRLLRIKFYTKFNLLP